METITITQNTPFRLINRIGNSNDKLSTLAEGELCYLVDKKRMVVGTADGYEYVGNKFYYGNTNEAVKNDIVYDSLSSGFKYYDGKTWKSLNTTGNINYDKNIFTIDSSGLTIKPIEGNSAYSTGKITAISIDKYGRLNHIQTNPKSTDTYYNFISNTNNLNLSANDLVSVTSSSISVTFTDIQNDNIERSSFDVWFTYNFSNDNYKNYIWYPMLSSNISATVLGMGEINPTPTKLTNIIVQLPKLLPTNTVLYYLNGTMVNANTYLTNNPLYWPASDNNE